MIFLAAFATNAGAVEKFVPHSLTVPEQEKVQQSVSDSYGKSPLQSVFYQGRTPEDLGLNKFKSDSKFDYYRFDTTVFRKYKSPNPLLEPGSAQSLSESPGLFWAGVFEFDSDDLGSVNPDCSERSFGFQDYLRLVEDPAIQSKADLLQKIPKDALQKFTFIHHSESLQRHGVDRMHPRVMRFSTDGRFVLTYTCDKAGQTQENVEVMYFDDATRRFNFAHTEFKKTSEDSIRSDGQKKTIENPRACLSCHGGSDPRPNWSPYPEWKGVYGSDDDLMARKTKSGEYKIFGGFLDSEKIEEAKNYEKMRISLQDNVCLSTLPWPSTKSLNFANFPYSPVEKLMNYRFRPNAHFTIAQSRLNAQRLARKFQEHPLWKNIKFQTLSRALRCEGSSASQTPLFQSLITTNSTSYSPYYRSTSPGPALFLYDVGVKLGFYESDWSLYFTRVPKLGIAPSFATAQWEMSDFVMSVLFSDVAREIPELLPYDLRYNRMSNLFGNRFMCMDKIADRMLVTEESQKKICEILLPYVQSERQLPVATYDPKQNIPENRQAPARNLISEKSRPTPELGQMVAQQVCMQCHTGEVLPINFANEEELKALLFKKGLQVRQLIDQKTGVGDGQCEMPMAISGQCLSKKEKASLLMYIDSLMH